MLHCQNVNSKVGALNYIWIQQRSGPTVDNLQLVLQIWRTGIHHCLGFWRDIGGSMEMLWDSKSLT